MQLRSGPRLSAAFLTLAVAWSTGAATAAAEAPAKAGPGWSASGSVVRLERALPGPALGRIAARIKGGLVRQSRMAVQFYLPSQKAGDKPWAIATFAPDLRLLVQGGAPDDHEVLRLEVRSDLKSADVQAVGADVAASGILLTRAGGASAAGAHDAVDAADDRVALAPDDDGDAAAAAAAAAERRLAEVDDDTPRFGRAAERSRPATVVAVRREPQRTVGATGAERQPPAPALIGTVPPGRGPAADPSVAALMAAKLGQ